MNFKNQSMAGKREIRNLRLVNLTKVIVALILFPMIHSCRQAESPFVKEINLSTDTHKRILKLSQIADSVKYIRLSTTPDSYLGEITKAIVTSNNIIISDRYTNSICVYDINGTFHNKIGSLGSETGQYTFIGDICFDESTGKVFIHGNPDKILGYSLDNKYLGSFGLAEYFVCYTYFSQGRFITYISYPNTYDKRQSSCIVVDENGRIVKSLLRQRHSFGKIKIGPFSNTYKMQDTICFWEAIDDVVYGVTDKLEIIPRFVLNLGSERISKKAFKTRESLNTAIREGATTLVSFVETSKFIIFNLVKNKFKKVCFYNKVDGSVFDIDYANGILFNDLDQGPNFQLIEQINQNTLLCILFPHEINSWRKSFLKIPGQEIHPLEKITNGISEMDNPVLVIINLKR